MGESRWRKMFASIWILSLQFPGALNKDLSLNLIVRAGDDVTLSCENVSDGHKNCDTTTWIYSSSGQAVEVVNLGLVKKNRSDRLKVSANCSLVLTKVTTEDVGPYTCRQFISHQQSGSDAVVVLSVVNLTEHQDQDKVTMSCSVLVAGQCEHEVKWSLKGKELDKRNQAITESSSSCSAAVTLRKNHYLYQSRLDLLKCEVKMNNKEQKFTFSFAPSDMKWVYITLPVVLAAFIITVVVFGLLKRTKGNKMEQNSTSADLENNLPYATISYTNKCKRVERDNKDNSVTYSTVKASCADPSNLYASIKYSVKISEDTQQQQQ